MPQLLPYHPPREVESHRHSIRFGLARGRVVDLEGDDGALGNTEGDAITERHCRAAWHAAGDEVARAEILPERQIREITVVHDRRVGWQDFGGADPRILPENMRQDDVLVVDVAVGRQRMGFQGRRHKVRLANFPFGFAERAWRRRFGWIARRTASLDPRDDR